MLARNKSAGILFLLVLFTALTTMKVAYYGRISSNLQWLPILASVGNAKGVVPWCKMLLVAQLLCYNVSYYYEEKVNLCRYLMRYLRR